MNNDENLHRQTNENGVNNELNQPLQEVTVETSVPEEPYPVTEISGNIDDIINEPPVNNDVQVIGEESAPSNTLESENPVTFPDAPTIAPAVEPTPEVEPTPVEAAPTMEPSPVEEPSANPGPVMGPSEPIVAPSVEPTVTSEPVQSTNTGFEDVNKKSKAGIIIAIIVVILLGVGGYFAYNMFFAKSPYENAITNAFKLLKSGNLSDPFKVTTTVKIESSSEDYSFLGDYSFDYAIAMDAKNGTSLATFNLNEKGTSILDVLAYLKDGKAYVQSKKLTDKTYYFDNVDFKEMTNEEDLRVLADAFEDALIAALKDEKETKKDAKISVGGKSIDVTENIYTIDKNNMGRVTKNSIDSLLSNEEAIKVLAKITDAEVSDIKKHLEDAKNEDYSNYSTTASISIYTKGFLKTFAGFSLSEDKTEVIRYVVDGDNESFVMFLGSDKDKFTVDADGEKADIKLVFGGETLATGKVTYKENYANIVLEIQEYGKITIEVKKEDNVKIDSIDTSKAVKYEDISQEDLESIMTKLNEIYEKTEAYSKLESYMNSNTSYIDDTTSSDDDWSFNFDNSLEG